MKIILWFRGHMRKNVAQHEELDQRFAVLGRLRVRCPRGGSDLWPASQEVLLLPRK